VFRSIFLFGEFKLPVKIDAKLIIDAGAYTGLSALYYASKYPNAKVITIEPETSNFEVLKKNTENIKNISRIQAGLWNKEAFLKIVDRETGNWGFTVKEVSESEKYDIQATTLDVILRNSGFSKIDILKIDIEGSEKELFSGNYESWLSKVNILVVELHDRIKDGCTQALSDATDKNIWTEYTAGEKVILIRKQFL
jgi:FkbM family methyltransferase